MAGVVLVDFDPGWTRAFETIRDRLRTALGDLAERVEHVGSTSVPGLPAKPVIDVDIVAVPDRFPACITRLETAGWSHRGDLGVAGREAFRGPADLPRHHLYLCARNGLALRNHLAVRDRLRSDPEAARAYADLKVRLAAECGPDREAYTFGKTRFLIELLRESEFPDADLAAIEAENRPGTPQSTSQPESEHS